MAAVSFALLSAILFGAMAVALALAFRRSSDAEAGAFASGIVALAVTATIAALTSSWGGAIWPFAATGLIAPGASQLLYVRAVREVGASRAAVVVGMAPLVSVTIALTLLDEPVEAALVVGAVLVVLGGAALAGERDRPSHFRRIGLLLALGSVLFFATRDNLVRWLARDTDVDPQLAAAASIFAGCALMGGYLVATRRRHLLADVRRAAAPFAATGILWGLSTAALFEAFYRGRVSVVSPLVATEALFGVVFATLVLGTSELVGRHVVLGAVLVVAGGVLIGAFR